MGRLSPGAIEVDHLLKASHLYEINNASKQAISRKNNNSVFAQTKASTNLMKGVRSSGAQNGQI